MLTRFAFRILSTVIATAALFAGCSSVPNETAASRENPSPASGRLEPRYDASGKLTTLEYDRNNDGKIDTWGFMSGTRIVRVESDENGDGRVDRWEYHRPDAPTGSGASPTTQDRTIERVERATRFDGRVSRWEYFTDGVLSRIEEDTDGDGRIDKWETYANGTLVMIALDSLGRGVPDRRLVYRADGSFDRIEVDQTGSGNFQPLPQ